MEERVTDGIAARAVAQDVSARWSGSRRRQPAGGLCTVRPGDQAGRAGEARRAGQPAEAAKPAATTAAAAPATAPAKPAEAAKPAADAKPAAPAAAGKPGDQKLGAQLVGKWEGGEILDEAKRPAKLGESPLLADMVKAGKLPPVEQRIPEAPMVIKPLEGIGKYGGVWRRASRPGRRRERQPGHVADRPVFWDYQGVKQRPG